MVALLSPPAAREQARSAATLATPPFTLGVAAVDVRADGAQLWTRLAQAPLEGRGGMPACAFLVRWDLARDEAFRRVLTAGSTVAMPEYAHSVHVTVRGLEASGIYWYRFEAGGHRSPVGMLRIAPSRTCRVEAVQVGVASVGTDPATRAATLTAISRDDLALCVLLRELRLPPVLPSSTPDALLAAGRRAYAEQLVDPEARAITQRMRAITLLTPPAGVHGAWCAALRRAAWEHGMSLSAWRGSSRVTWGRIVDLNTHATRDARPSSDAGPQRSPGDAAWTLDVHPRHLALRTFGRDGARRSELTARFEGGLCATGSGAVARAGYLRIDMSVREAHCETVDVAR